MDGGLWIRGCRIEWCADGNLRCEIDAAGIRDAGRVANEVEVEEASGGHTVAASAGRQAMSAGIMVIGLV
jgi:hypothetical protein